MFIFLIILLQILLIATCIGIIALSYTLPEIIELPKIVVDNELIIGNNSVVVVNNTDEDWE
tara:strand:- start:497 stop:679 length:183 start_codon:yes stop_codon:yes gene_type:complete